MALLPHAVNDISNLPVLLVLSTYNNNNTPFEKLLAIFLILATPLCVVQIGLDGILLDG